MGATHHLVLNVRFRESKSTVKVKSVFDSLPFLFLYHEYKIRNISIFYSLEFYFLQRTGEWKYILFIFPYFMIKLGEKYSDRGKVV